MPKATLLYPSTYKVGGQTFQKDKQSSVDIPMAVYLSTRQNFDVDMEGLTAQEIQEHMFSREKSAQKPHDPQVVMNQIKIAAVALDPDDKANFTKEGRLDSRALSRVLGYTVTSDERDEAIGAEPPAKDQKTSKLLLARRQNRRPEAPKAGQPSDSETQTPGAGVTI